MPRAQPWAARRPRSRRRKRVKDAGCGDFSRLSSPRIDKIRLHGALDLSPYPDRQGRYAYDRRIRRRSRPRVPRDERRRRGASGCVTSPAWCARSTHAATEALAQGHGPLFLGRTVMRLVAVIDDLAEAGRRHPRGVGHARNLWRQPAVAARSPLRPNGSCVSSSSKRMVAEIVEVRSTIDPDRLLNAPVGGTVPGLRC